MESKAKRLPTLIEEKQRKYQIIRDLKGVVDGVKFTTKNKKTIKKQVPSLIEKIEYVKQNSKKFEIRNNNHTNFVGVIITPNYPWISEYRNVKILTINQIHELISMT